MEREELEGLGYWERQVASSKMWDELTTKVYSIDDAKGRTPAQVRLRRTDWAGWWLYTDGETFQLLEDAEVYTWKLKESR